MQWTTESCRIILCPDVTLSHAGKTSPLFAGMRLRYKAQTIVFSCQEMPKCINNTEGCSVLIQSALSCAEFSAITCQSAPPPEPPTQKHIFLNPLTRSATTCVKEYAQCVPNMSD